MPTPHTSTATSMAALSTSGSTARAGSSDGMPGMSSTPRPFSPRVETRPSSTWTATGSRNARRSWSPTTTPTTPDRPERSWRPSGFGPVYPSSFAASSTRARVSGVIGPAPENAREAVETETPASSATLASVGR
ncbi:Uncharacterised protein [Mycobacteroides abscessus]|nr:Uncharacterised protein [Mycobacteroides abscessus]